MDGGTAAGLRILRLVKAPVAAVLAYGLEDNLFDSPERNVLVFDLDSRGIGKSSV
jgi:molecular chaperone DnaK (HSP70)